MSIDDNPGERHTQWWDGQPDVPPLPESGKIKGRRTQGGKSPPPASPPPASSPMNVEGGSPPSSMDVEEAKNVMHIPDGMPGQGPFDGAEADGKGKFHQISNNPSGGDEWRGQYPSGDEDSGSELESDIDM